MIKFLKAGGAVALPWFYSAKAFKNYFSPGVNPNILMVEIA
jgi:hypothetical protein